MTAIADLPPEQRAALSLVLGKGRSFAEIATLLQIDADAVRERAHAALEEIGPRDGTAPPPPRRIEVGDYLLGQQAAAEANATRDYLAGSAVGRAWARSLAAELRFVAASELPEIPVESANASPPLRQKRAEPKQEKPAGAGGAEASRPAVSRRGGAILLGGVAALAAVVAIVVLLTRGDGGSGSSAKARSTASTPTAATPAAPTKVLGQVNLTAPNKRSRATGVATLLQQGTTKGIALQVTGLPATTSKFAYAVWLYNSHARAERIGFAPAVKSDGKLGAVAPTPVNLGTYRALIITRESTTRPARPGAIVLSGPLPKHA